MSKKKTIDDFKKDNAALRREIKALQAESPGPFPPNHEDPPPPGCKEALEAERARANGLAIDLGNAEAVITDLKLKLQQCATDADNNLTVQ